MTQWLNENNAQVGQIVEMSGSNAKIHEVIDGLGIVVDTLGAGHKLRITYQFSELSMRGAKIVEAEEMNA